jgi:hypothetical protein
MTGARPSWPWTGAALVLVLACCAGGCGRAGPAYGAPVTVACTPPGNSLAHTIAAVALADAGVAMSLTTGAWFDSISVAGSHRERALAALRDDRRFCARGGVILETPPNARGCTRYDGTLFWVPGPGRESSALACFKALVQDQQLLFLAHNQRSRDYGYLFCRGATMWRGTRRPSEGHARGGAGGGPWRSPSLLALMWYWYAPDKDPTPRVERCRSLLDRLEFGLECLEYPGAGTADEWYVAFAPASATEPADVLPPGCGGLVYVVESERQVELDLSQPGMPMSEVQFRPRCWGPLPAP